MNNEKLIDDAVTAFADREIAAPSRDHLRIALNAFEASLTRCGCGACTVARRERTGLTEHDRTAVARVLHEIVYAPGANFDRAVPGVQEHMLACAEKVAAALPWIVPTPEVEVSLDEVHAPTEDDRIELAAATIAVVELVRSRRTWGDLLDVQKDEYRRVAREVLQATAALGTEPEGEPSDAQVEAAASAMAEYQGAVWPDDLSEDEQSDFREGARVALRAAGGVQ